MPTMPTLTLSKNTAKAGERITVTGSGFPSGARLQVEVCGIGGSSNSCAITDAALATTDAFGGFRQNLVVTEPPTPCPCTVHAAPVRRGRRRPRRHPAEHSRSALPAAGAAGCRGQREAAGRDRRRRLAVPHPDRRGRLRTRHADLRERRRRPGGRPRSRADALARRQAGRALSRGLDRRCAVGRCAAGAGLRGAAAGGLVPGLRDRGRGRRRGTASRSPSAPWPRPCGRGANLWLPARWLWGCCACWRAGDGATRPSRVSRAPGGRAGRRSGAGVPEPFSTALSGRSDRGTGDRWGSCR